MKAVLPFSLYGKRRVTAFALVGDRYHNIDYIRTALGKTLGRDLGISIDFTDELSLLDSEELEGLPAAHCVPRQGRGASGCR